MGYKPRLGLRGYSKIQNLSHLVDTQLIQAPHQPQHKITCYRDTEEVVQAEVARHGTPELRLQP